MAEGDNQGQCEAHTRGADGASAGDLDLGGVDPAAVLDGLPSVTRGDLLEAVAELTAAKRRGRGRPPGSPNRKNRDMIAFLDARGLRDPWLTLATIQAADTKALAKMLGADTPKLRIQVLAIQKAAAEAILPYHHAKQPQQLDLGDLSPRRPLMVIGEMKVAIGADGGAFMSAGQVVEYQEVSEASSVRGEADPSHDVAKPLKDNDNPTSTG